ncbi:MAG: ribose-phosphate diphosphokinase [Spirochaetaceae bacterium]|nr:ribose-phosphate diphosphokinase [Spirochaetaceae bacterium]
MHFSRSVNLGIIACPGATFFTEDILHNLKKYYSRKHEKQVDFISRVYGIDKAEVERQINLLIDIQTKTQTSNIEEYFDIEKYRVPDFKIPVKYTRFANGEYKAEVKTSVRGMDVFIIQDVENHYPMDINGDGKKYILSVNDHVFTLFATIDAVIQSGARSVSIVVPAYPYARQHKRKGREALTAALFGRIIENMGVSRIITLDIHSKEIENCLNKCRMEDLHASYQIIRTLVSVVDIEKSDIVIVAPDTGAVERNKFFAGSLNKPLAMLYKERDYSKVSADSKDSNITSMRLLGDVKGKVVFMADDMVGTGGTMIKAMKHLRDLGADKVICAISLPFFTGNAIADFDDAYRKGYFDKIIGTNAVYHDDTLYGKEWYINASISNLFARIISRLHLQRTLNPLIDNNAIIQQFLKSSQSDQFYE